MMKKVSSCEGITAGIIIESEACKEVSFMIG
jgi:hypothetical protein